MSDEDAAVQQHALALTRNLVHKLTPEQFRDLFPVQEFAAHLLHLLKKAKSPATLTQALYVCSNIAESNPQLLLEHGAVAAVIALVEVRARVTDSTDTRQVSNPADVLMASLWCLVNLTWSAEDDILTRVKQLAAYGFLDRLRQISQLETLAVDVQDRAKQVLEQMVPRD
jgi:hypothetical protein